MFVQRGSSLSNSQYYAQTLANAVNGLYAKLNFGIRVVLVSTFTFTNQQAEINTGLYTTSSESMDTYLSRFTSWRRTYSGYRNSNLGSCSTPGFNGCANLANDEAMLLTGTDRSGGVIGLAWIGTVCGVYSSGVIESSRTSTQLTIQTLAHEMGHNWGSNHDSAGLHSHSHSHFLFHFH